MLDAGQPVYACLRVLWLGQAYWQAAIVDKTMLGRRRHQPFVCHSAPSPLPRVTDQGA